MSTPRPITWYRLGDGCTATFERDGGSVYIISDSGNMVLVSMGTPRIQVPFFEIRQGDGGPNIYEQVRDRIQALEDTHIRECLRNKVDFSGQLYGLIRFHDTVQNDKGYFIDTMRLALALSTNPLSPYFSDNPLSPFGDEAYKYHVMENLECWNHGVPTWIEPEILRPSRFEREWVI
jgi:hypothetical protein